MTDRTAIQVALLTRPERDIAEQRAERCRDRFAFWCFVVLTIIVAGVLASIMAACPL